MISRPDKRDDNSQLRAFSASQNILNKADGSAKFEFGKITTTSSIFTQETNLFYYRIYLCHVLSVRTCRSPNP
jgi:ribonuclease PH